MAAGVHDAGGLAGFGLRHDVRGVGDAGFLDDGERVHVAADEEGGAGAVFEDADDAIGAGAVGVEADVVGDGVAGGAEIGGEEGGGVGFEVGELGVGVELFVDVDERGGLLGGGGGGDGEEGRGEGALEQKGLRGTGGLTEGYRLWVRFVIDGDSRKGYKACMRIKKWGRVFRGVAGLYAVLGCAGGGVCRASNWLPLPAARSENKDPGYPWKNYVVPAASDKAAEDLPDAPLPNVPAVVTPDSTGAAIEPAWRRGALFGGTQPGTEGGVKLRDCPYDTTHARECHVRWGQLAIESSIFVTFQNVGNAYTGFFYRYETSHGKWLDRYFASVTGYKFSVWSDGNPMLDDYVGHPMMGAITNYLWIQNDPRGETLEFSNTYPYWRSRLRALAFSAAYSTQWKLGPAGESGVGHAGDHLAYDDHRYRVETGFVSLVTTPFGGFIWSGSEDVLDKYVITRLERLSSNPFALTLYSFLSPARATANILRFRPVWYRDSRVVKATGFWSDPGPGEAGVTQELPGGRHLKQLPSYITVEPELTARPTDEQFDRLPGGKHELGAWWGMSLHSGHIFGFEKNVRYMPIDVRYSYRFFQRPSYTLRYSPEITALSLIDEPAFVPVDFMTLRRRTYGSGVSPVGFQGTLLPKSRVQPFGSMNGGFIYYADKVLSSDGSRFMYTIDFGAGVNIFRKKSQAYTLGYRYTHLSNADISLHNPGTDANTFYVGVSRFRNR